MTYKLASYYKNIQTLGFALTPETDVVDVELMGQGARRDIPHIEYDLNKAKDVDTWPETSGFDLIVYAETIEHLYEAPEFTLLMLRSMLKPGGIIVCTTPNGAYFLKRVRCVRGLNPQEKIRLFSLNPGHYREYTRKELEDMGKKAGLSAIYHEFIDYSHSGNPIVKFIKTMIGIVPSWRLCQVSIFK